MLNLQMDFTVHQLKSTPSTNKWLENLITTEQAGEGFVVCTEIQTAGRGYGQNSWESEEGKNLTFSLLLQPFFITPEQQFLLTQIVSLALVDVLMDILPQKEIKIKWPNDIYIGNRKVAGILIQNFIKGQTIDYSIVGVGLNVNQRHFISDAPNPVSLIHLTGKPLEREKLLNSILNRIEKYYGQSASMLFREEINKRYLLNLFSYGQTTVFKEKGEAFNASITGIGKSGQLILQHENGAEKLYAFKEVEFVL